MEFLFDFVLAPQKRVEIVRRLFPGAHAGVDRRAQLGIALRPHPENNLEPGTVHGGTLHAAISKANRPFVIFSTKGAPGSIEILSGADGGCIASIAKGANCRPNRCRWRSSRRRLTPYRLRLGRPEEAAAAWPISYELADAVYQQFANLEWADPMRKLPTSSPIQGGHVLARGYFQPARRPALALQQQTQTISKNRIGSGQTRAAPWPPLHARPCKTKPRWA